MVWRSSSNGVPLKLGLCALLKGWYTMPIAKSNDIIRFDMGPGHCPVLYQQSRQMTHCVSRLERVHLLHNLKISKREDWKFVQCRSYLIEPTFCKNFRKKHSINISSSQVTDVTAFWIIIISIIVPGTVGKRQFATVCLKNHLKLKKS